MNVNKCTILAPYEIDSPSRKVIFIQKSRCSHCNPNDAMVRWTSCNGTILRDVARKSFSNFCLFCVVLRFCCSAILLELFCYLSFLLELFCHSVFLLFNWSYSSVLVFQWGCSTILLFCYSTGVILLFCCSAFPVEGFAFLLFYWNSSYILLFCRSDDFTETILNAFFCSSNRVIIEDCVS